jgi:predicted dehydrogenase
MAAARAGPAAGRTIHVADKIRIAFIGCGGIAGKHARTFQASSEVQVVAGMDVKDELVNAFFDRALPGTAPRPAAFTATAELYRQARPDAVVICSPHTLHFEQGMEALEHGCHVLMEKPMVTSAAQAHALKAKADASGKVFIIAYNTPCSPEFMYLRELIRTKALGKLEMVSGHLSQGWLKATLGSWRQKPELSGGGQAYDSGAHLLNSLCWSVESRPREVCAMIDNCGSPVDINSVFIIRFESGTLASIAISGNCPGGSSHMSFLFDGGRVEIDPWGAGWIRIFQGADPVKYPPITGKPCQPADNFIDAILGRDAPRATAQNGVVHSELMDLIYASARSGQPARAKPA